jgi:hypothetical protein
MASLLPETAPSRYGRIAAATAAVSLAAAGALLI